MKTSNVVTPKVSQSIRRNNGGVKGRTGGVGTAWVAADRPCLLGCFSFSMLIVLAVIGMDTYPTRVCIHRQFSVWLDNKAAIALFDRNGSAAVRCPWHIGPDTL